MKIGQAFPANYLKKEDCGNTGIVLTIKDVKVEDVGGNNDPADMKPVIVFHETDRGLVCNKTNAELLSHYLGSDETDTWLGKQIHLVNDPSISFGGKLTGGIRVRPVQSVQQPVSPVTTAQAGEPLSPASPQARPTVAQAAPSSQPAFDDDIPI